MIQKMKYPADIPVKLVQRIQDALSPDLIDKHWQEKSKDRALDGFCYIASEVLYHLVAKHLGYTPAQMWVHIGGGRECSHWFLRKGEAVVDITAVQFGKTPIPYRKAHGCGFFTKKPSNAAQEIMRRIGYDPETLANYRALARYVPIDN
jgi:hypothetical protein